MTPTARTLQWLKKHGWTSCVVEKWIPQTRQRKDVFGFGDILAFKESAVLLIQCTSAGNMASRLTKIRGIREAADWLNEPSRQIVLIGWSKKGKAGARKLWTPRIVRVLPGDRILTVEEL